MTYKKALKLTKTKNANQLAEFVGVSHTAAYKWEKRATLPVTAEVSVLKAIGQWPVQKAS